MDREGYLNARDAQTRDDTVEVPSSAASSPAAAGRPGSTGARTPSRGDSFYGHDRPRNYVFLKPSKPDSSANTDHPGWSDVSSDMSSTLESEPPAADRRAAWYSKAQKPDRERKLAKLVSFLLSQKGEHRGAEPAGTESFYGHAVEPESFYGHGDQASKRRRDMFYGHVADSPTQGEEGDEELRGETMRADVVDHIRRESPKDPPKLNPALSLQGVSGILDYVKTYRPAILGEFTEEELREALGRVDSVAPSRSNGVRGRIISKATSDSGDGSSDSGRRGSSSSESSSFYGFYGQEWSFYGKSELAEWIRDHSDSSFLDRLPVLSEIEDPRVRKIVKKLYDRFSSSDRSSSDSDRQSGSSSGSSAVVSHRDDAVDDDVGSGIQSSEDGNGVAVRGEGQSDDSVGRAAAEISRAAPSQDFYGVYGLHHASETSGPQEQKSNQELLSVSFTLTVTDYYPTQAEADELLFRIQRSIQEAAGRLGVARYLEFAQISPPQQVGPDTVALDVEVVFNHNANGVYQLAQMLRENVIYVFPLTEYSGAQVSDVKVSAYNPDMPPADLPYGGSNSTGYAAQTAFNANNTGNSARVKDEHSGGCALDRFSLNGSPNCCFAPFQLDAKYECCKDPLGVDECGVCGGSEQSCALQFSTRISVPADDDFADVTSKAYNALVQKYQQGIALLFSEFDFIASDVEVAANTVNVQGGVLRRLLSAPEDDDQPVVMRQLQSVDTQTVDITANVEPRIGLVLPKLALVKKLFQKAADQKAQYEDLQFMAILEVKRAGVCFNGFCEVGEMSDPLNPSSASGTCPQDCPVTKLCPMPVRPVAGEAMKPCAGRGTCNDEEGTCLCDRGYVGEACSKCAHDYLLSGSTCISSCPVSPGLNSILVGDPDAVCGNRGMCDSVLRACKCQRGYNGADCGACDVGYSPRDGECTWDATLASIRDTSGGSDQGTSDTGNNSLAVAIAASLTVALGLLALGIFVYLKHSQRAQAREQFDGVVSTRSSTSLSRQVHLLENLSLYPEVGASSADPDLPTRQEPTDCREDIPTTLLTSTRTTTSV
eukprot:CAMPEP_0117658272 /NCGR_PEP_ID=MMETSP0804-20121206/5776_1 /TAXON_ID=1074897 /ORGANISM="Tetraselmis astigmatica, Strain CCMP880" /LENGTH=1053 /DNA_ID=CAMNT_0005464783 /DNA_START=254 /DNA_END=3415 /DNA_ORIENTATION=+